MTNKRLCCSDCWGWPADKTPEEGYCTHQFCKCHKVSCCDSCRTLIDRDYTSSGEDEWSCREDFKNCPCHKTSSLQDLMREREEASVIELRQYMRGWAMVDPEMTLVLGNVRRMINETARLAFLAGMEEAKGCVPEKRTRNYYRPEGSEYKEGEHDGWNELHEITLAAIEKKSREVGEGLV